MDFKGLDELTKALQKAASDSDIQEVNKRIVEKSQPVVKKIMSGKIPRSGDISKSGHGFGSKGHPSAHAADSVPVEKIRYRGTSASGEVGWNKGANDEHFYAKFINWGTIYQPPREFILKTTQEADEELRKIAEQEYQRFLDNTVR